MQRGSSFNPFEADEAYEFTLPTWARWFLFGVLLSITMGAVVVVGYSLRRGVWAVPPSIIAHVPPSLASWLLPALSGGGGTPGQLEDYAFELVDAQVKQGEAVVTVRLMHKPMGKPVSNAVIFAHRIDMAPEGMATMTAPLELLPAADPGTYRFKTDLMMEGGWQLSLAAKVQGEIGTVQNQLLFKAVP